MEELELPAPRQHRAVIEHAIATDEIRSLHLGPPITLPRDATLAEVVHTLQDKHIGCVLITAPDGTLCGIFTERDLLNRAAAKGLDWSKERVSSFMTPEPETLRPEDRIAWALNLMHIGGYRHVPLTDDQGRPVGVVSVKDVVDFIVDLFPAAVLNLPPDPRRKPSADSLGGGED